MRSGREDLEVRGSAGGEWSRGLLNARSAWQCQGCQGERLYQVVGGREDWEVYGLSDDVEVVRLVKGGREELEVHSLCGNIEPVKMSSCASG